MRKLVYDVAISLDGFIASPKHTIEGFLAEGSHVHDYWERLKQYDTTIMGRSTYEFGYNYGLKAGERAYPHMRHYIFSRSLPFESNEKVNVVRSHWLETVKQLKEEQGSEIYLCGGGRLAGLLLEHGMIDTLILKINPILLGSGVKLFDASFGPWVCAPISRKIYDNGVTLDIYSLGSAR